MLTLRPATKSDCVHAVHVVRTVFEEYGFTWEAEDYHADLYDLEYHYLSRGDLFWIAEWNGKAVGTAALNLHSRIPGDNGCLVVIDSTIRVSGTDCGLNRLYLLPEYRGKGIGKALMEEVIQTAKSLNRDAMEIWSDKRFNEAHALYQKYSAIICGERICDDPDESPEWGLILRLK